MGIQVGTEEAVNNYIPHIPKGCFAGPLKFIDMHYNASQDTVLMLMLGHQERSGRGHKHC